MTTIPKQGPLSWNTPIVYPDGRPTQEFMRKWAAQVAANTGIPVDAKTLSAILDFLGTTRGAIIERGATQWGIIAPGTDGKVFRSKGVGADPIWDTISNVLDTAISSTRGSVLYRGASGWVALGPGTAGNVLTTNGGGADPTWAAGSATPTGTGIYGFMPAASVGADALASLGTQWIASAAVKLTGLFALLTTVTGRTYTLNYAPYNASTNKITSAATILGTFAETASETGKVIGFTCAPITLAAGTYLFWLSRTDSTTTATPQLYFTSSASRAWPFFKCTNNLSKLASIAPTTSDTWAAVTNTYFILEPLFTI